MNQPDPPMNAGEPLRSAGHAPAPATDSAASASEPLIRRITDRLAVDPELRLEVARELQTHLEDCEAEFLAGGACEAEALASAQKALGDPAELSEQLWQANRGRLRFRALMRWAAGAALFPSAIATVLILVMSISVFPVLPLVWAVALGGMDTAGPSWPRTGTEETDFILRGEANAPTHVQREKSIADRWPENPVYYGNYVQALMAEPNSGFYDRLYPSPSRVSEMLPILDRGEAVDPNNAFYNLHKASWLLAASCELKVIEAETKPTEEPNIASESPWSWGLRVTDANLYQRGLEEIRRAADKPLFANRAVEMFALRRGLLPSPRSIVELLRGTGNQEYVGLLRGPSEYRQLAKIACTHALQLAEKGDSSARAWADLALRVSDKIGAEAPTAIEVLSAYASRALAIGAQEWVARALGQQQAACDANDEYQAMDRFFNGWFHTRMPASRLRHAGLYWQLIAATTPGQSELDFEPVRTAENWVALQAGLVALLCAGVLLAIVLGAMTLWSRLRRPKEQRPILLFVGWRRLGSVCLFSIVIPLACYGVYAYWQFTGPDAYGLNYTGGRILVELTTLGSGVFLLLLGMSYKAIRTRAVEVGLEVPEPFRLRRRPVMAGLCLVALAASLGYAIGWWAGPFRGEVSAPKFGPEWVMLFFGGVRVSVISVVLSGAVAGVAGLVIVREFIGLLFQRRLAPFRRAMCRSLVPVVCSAVILIGIACGVSLSRGERSASRRIAGDAWQDVSNEMETSGYRALRCQFVEWCKQDAGRAERSQVPDTLLSPQPGR